MPYCDGSFDIILASCFNWNAEACYACIECNCLLTITEKSENMLKRKRKSRRGAVGFHVLINVCIDIDCVNETQMDFNPCGHFSQLSLLSAET